MRFCALIVLIALCLPSLSNAASLSTQTMAPAGHPAAWLWAQSPRVSDDSVEAEHFRTLRRGRAQVGFAVGMQSFQVLFAILARALADPLGPWAPGDSMGIEAIASLVSIISAPVGVLGFKNLATNPRRGVATGLLEGGIYALSYAGLHLLFTGISEALPSGGQGNAFVFLFVGLPMITSHLLAGIGMTIAGAVVLAKSNRRLRESAGNAAPFLFPAPLLRRDGGGLALVAVF